MTRTLPPPAAFAIVALISVVSAGCGSNAPSETGAGSSATAAHETAMKFSACMRHNGVGAFPDPGASGKLTIDAVANGSSLDTNSATFKKAVSACKDLEPPGFVGGKRSAQQQDAALKFAQCIRENGVTDFPDPVSGQPLVDTNRIPSSATSGGMTILNAAMQTCRSLGAKAGASR
jgi:hypothetical protein